ncbi:MAG: hypothetical protein IPJ13_03985 [Saprospiraceae bacterium]|nr:hypothetical protein [Saprospiraceae bacterium]
MHSTSYIIRFTLIMTVIVAAVLSLMVSGLKDIHTENESVDNKKGILSAVATQLGKEVNTLSNSEVQRYSNHKSFRKLSTAKVKN